MQRVPILIRAKRCARPNENMATERVAIATKSVTYFRKSGNGASVNATRIPFWLRGYILFEKLARADFLRPAYLHSIEKMMMDDC